MLSIIKRRYLCGVPLRQYRACVGISSEYETPATANGEPRMRHRQPRTENRERETGNRERGTANEKPATANEKQAAQMTVNGER